MKTLEIIIRGKPMSGKSRLAATVARLLEAIYSKRVMVYDEGKTWLPTDGELARLAAIGPDRDVVVSIKTEMVHSAPYSDS